jgi:hypothetical protein
LRFSFYTVEAVCSPRRSRRFRAAPLQEYPIPPFFFHGALVAQAADESFTEGAPVDGLDQFAKNGILGLDGGFEKGDAIEAEFDLFRPIVSSSGPFSAS